MKNKLIVSIIPEYVIQHTSNKCPFHFLTRLMIYKSSVVHTSENIVVMRHQYVNPKHSDVDNSILRVKEWY